MSIFDSYRPPPLTQVSFFRYIERLSKEEPHPKIRVYFVQHEDDGPIKIGSGIKPWERLSQLQVGTPMQLNMLAWFVAPPKLEQRLHRILPDEDRIRGEWFHPSQRVAWIMDACRELFEQPACGECERIVERVAQGGSTPNWQGQIHTCGLRHTVAIEKGMAEIRQSAAEAAA